MTEEIQIKLIEEEVKKRYIDYSMSVITGRALPDARDGLKPVQRRILYSMWKSNTLSNKPYVKSARIVGNVMGRLHPHGDAAIYDTMVRMAQDFSLRYKLIDGQGNWGCFTGDIKIKLVDGTSKSFKELCDVYKQNEIFYVYSVDKNGRIVIGEATNPRITKMDARLVEITIDNREKIRCTPNHKFLLRDGLYKEAKDLTPNDSLMAAYFKLSPIIGNTELKDYLMIKGQKEGRYLFVHDLSDKYNHKIITVRFLNYTEDVYDITVKEHHNFLLDCGVFVHNSIDGDPAAAQRYSEARLTRLSEEILQDLDRDTVDFVPNFDGSTKEPVVLPSKFPNLLINGVTGIAVGMATNMPPHNLREVIDATLYLIENKECSVNDLMGFIKGPDFPTGALIINSNGIKEAYETGRGKFQIKAKAKIEDRKIIVTEIPYIVNKSALIENIANLARDGRIEDISDIRDESDKRGIRIVFELKRDANPEVILNKLYKYSQLKVTFGIISIALVNNEPKVLNLKELIKHFVEHRRVVVTRRAQFDLKKAEERAHILSGLKIALQNIDSVVSLIKRSENPEIARNGLIQNYSLSEIQANAILEMKLQRLTSLEQSKISDEYNELIKLISELKIILSDELKIYEIIKNELNEIKDKYGDERRTLFSDDNGDVNEEDLIKEEDVVVLMTNLGYIKRTPIEVYKQQKRGGRGVTVSNVKDEDVTEQILTTSTHNTLLMFSNLGKAYWLKAYEIPESNRYTRGENIKNILKLSDKEKINTIVSIKQFDDGHYLNMITKKGVFKKVKLSEFSRPRSTGIIAINLSDNDELVQVRLTPGNLTLMIGTKNGNAVRFNEASIRPMGRNASGVRGIRLNNDEVIGMEVSIDDGYLLTVTENGYGKRTSIPEYRLTNRGGSGIININVTEKTGKVVGIKTVKDSDEILLLSEKGIAIRVPVNEVSVIGRNTQGVRVMRLDDGDKVSLITRIVKTE